MQDQPQLPIDFGPCTRVFSTLFITRPGAHLVSDLIFQVAISLSLASVAMSTKGGDSGWGERKQLRMNRWQFFFSDFHGLVPCFRKCFKMFMDLFHGFPAVFSLFLFKWILVACVRPFFRIFHGISPNISPVLGRDQKNHQNPCVGDFIVPHETGTQKTLALRKNPSNPSIAFSAFSRMEKTTKSRLWGSTSRSYNPSYPCTRPFIGTSTPFLTPPPRNKCSIRPEVRETNWVINPILNPCFWRGYFGGWQVDQPWIFQSEMLHVFLVGGDQVSLYISYRL